MLPCTDDIRVVDIRTAVLEVQQTEVCAYREFKNKLDLHVLRGESYSFSTLTIYDEFNFSSVEPFVDDIMR